MALARGAGAHSVLNVAPAAPVPDAVLCDLDFLIVNEHEALEVYAGCGLGGTGSGDLVVGALAAAIAVAAKHHVAVIVTLGARGAAACLPRRPSGCDVQRTDGGCDVMTVSAAPLTAGEKILDTVGAGDAFVGAFCAALASGSPLHVCMQRASAAGTVACTAVGAQAGVPSQVVLDQRVIDRPPEVVTDWGIGSEPALAHREAPGLAWGREKR